MGRFERCIQTAVMKRKTLLLACFVTICAFALMRAAFAANPPSGPKKDDGYQTPVGQAILVEAESGTVLFEKNADQLVPPASMAKLMTAEVVFNEVKAGKIKLDDEFVISERTWRSGGAPSGGATMFAAIHSRVPVRDLLQGVIIQNANDGCMALAEGIAGNDDNFARMMNDRARELGLSKSHFTNPSGLPHPDMRMTVRELSLLARHVIRTYPDLYKWYAEPGFLWNKIRQPNRNPLLAMNIGADGLHTGYTEESGYGLIGSAVQKGMRLVVALNGASSPKERADEARKLLEWGFNNFESRMLFAEDQTVGEARVFGGEKRNVPLIGLSAIRLLVQRNGGEKLVARVVYTGPVAAPVEKGQKIGVLRVFRGENVALEVPLQAAESVEQGTLSQRAFDAASEYLVGLLRSGLKKL